MHVCIILWKCCILLKEFLEKDELKMIRFSIPLALCIPTSLVVFIVTYNFTYYNFINCPFGCKNEILVGRK